MKSSILLTCRGFKKEFGVNKLKDLAVVVDSHALASKEPKQYAVFLPKFSSAIPIIKNSGCFALNFTNNKNFSREFDDFDGKDCEKLDCLKLKNTDSWLECEVKHELDLGDHILFIASVLFES